MKNIFLTGFFGIISLNGTNLAIAELVHFHAEVATIIANVVIVCVTLYKLFKNSKTKKDDK